MGAFLRMCVAVFSSWEVLAALAVLFIAGALLRFAAVGRTHVAAGGFSLKMLKKVKKTPTPAEAAAGVPPEAREGRGGKNEDKEEEIGLEEESYPTEDDSPKKRKRG